MAAEQARKLDPQLAAKYKRLMAAERHHDSAVCHIATTLVTRIATCWRHGELYQIRDMDGTPITQDEGKRIVQEHHQIPKTTSKKKTTSGLPSERQAGSQRLAERSNIPTCHHQAYEPPGSLTLP